MGLAGIARRVPGGKGAEHAATNGTGPDVQDPGHATRQQRGAVLRTEPAPGRPGRVRGEGEKRTARVPEHTLRSRRPARSRSRVGLVLVSFFALLMAGLLATPAQAQDTVEVPRSWPLKPSGQKVGDEFRLMLVTSTTRNARSPNIEDYKASATVTLPWTVTGGPWGSNVRWAWTRTDAEGNPGTTVTLAATNVVQPTFVVPVLAAATDVKLTLVATGRGEPSLLAGDYASSPSSTQFTIRALVPTALGVILQSVGDAYRPGEIIEFAVTFGDTVVVDGTPRLGFGLSDAGTNRHADYVRGSGTCMIVFACTVKATDPSDIRVGANTLELNGGTIRSTRGASALRVLTGFADDPAHPIATRDPTVGGPGAMPGKNVSKTRLLARFTESVT